MSFERRKLNHWTPTEDQQLLHLRNTVRKPWADIATILSRTSGACQAHYYILKQAREGSFIDWTPTQDEHIVNGRGRGLSIKAIALEMDLTSEAVADRWSHLQRHKLVPEDVLAVWRRKEDVVWSPDQDESIAKMWIQGMEDDEIVHMVKFKGKSQDDVRMRRMELVNGGGGGVYARLLGVGGDRETKEKTALEMALGKPKYSWMK